MKKAFVYKDKVKVVLDIYNNIVIMDGKVIFYEGNGGTQNPVKTVFTADGFDGKFSPNDEARSAKLYSVPAGSFL